MSKTELLYVVFKIALLLFAFYILYQVVRKLIGGSWSIEELILALVILNLGWIISIQKQLSAHLGEHKGYHYGKMNSQLKVE